MWGRDKMPAIKIHHPKTELRPEIQAAKDYYHFEYSRFKGARRASSLKLLKYFDLLRDWYNGAHPSHMATEHGVADTTMRNMLLTTQRRIETFIRLRQQGAL
jgi:hypothetical protein